MHTYELFYDGTLILCVHIDQRRTEEVNSALKEMVEFWSGWEERLAANDDDFLKTWFRQLIRETILRGVPCDREGWVPLDGSCGIRVEVVEHWEPEAMAMEATQRTGVEAGHYTYQRLF